MSSSVGSIPLGPGPSRSPIRRPAPSPDRALPPCGRGARQPHPGQISSANAARCQAARKRPMRSARWSNLPVTEGSRAPDRLPLDPMILPAHATPRAAAVLPQSVTAPASRPPHTVVPFPDSAICGPTVRILLSRTRRTHPCRTPRRDGSDRLSRRPRGAHSEGAQRARCQSACRHPARLGVWRASTLLDLPGARAARIGQPAAAVTRRNPGAEPARRGSRGPAGVPA